MAAPTLIRKAFIDHPASVDETYFEHFRVAMHYAKELAAASAKAMAHAFVPGMCCTSASDKIRQLHGEVTTGRRAELALAARAGEPFQAAGVADAGSGPAARAAS